VLTGVIKKVGPGPTIIVGSIVACIGLFTSSFAQKMSTIIGLTGVVAGIFPVSFLFTHEIRVTNCLAFL
jgi:hypothetical protein